MYYITITLLNKPLLAFRSKTTFNLNYVLLSITLSSCFYNFDELKHRRVRLQNCVDFSSSFNTSQIEMYLSSTFLNILVISTTQVLKIFVLILYNFFTRVPVYYFACVNVHSYLKSCNFQNISTHIFRF